MSFNQSVNTLNKNIATMFGETCRLFGTSGYVEIQAVFDYDYIETEQIQGERPMLYCRSVDVENIPTGSSYSRGGVDYIVKVKQQDSGGMTELILEEQ